jgi:hypothetical protein
MKAKICDAPCTEHTEFNSWSLIPHNLALWIVATTQGCNYNELHKQSERGYG